MMYRKWVELTAQTLPVNWLQSVMCRHRHCLSTDYRLHRHCLSTDYSLHRHCLSIDYSLLCAGTDTACPLTTVCTDTACPLMMICDVQVRKWTGHVSTTCTPCTWQPHQATFASLASWWRTQLALMWSTASRPLPSTKLQPWTTQRWSSSLWTGKAQ